jgi:uncharacterized protein YggE
MKKIITLFLAFVFLHCAIAQQAQPVYASNPYPKTITVSGSAEMEIVPDEIFVNVELKEYQKKGQSKINIETIKSQFLESCKAAGIPDSVISIASYSGDNNFYFIRRRKKDPDLLAGISYQIKFRNSKQMDDLVEKLDDEATQNFFIASVSHSKMTEFRKQLKIKAIQAAKEKANYLAESINEKAEEAITIKEPEEWQPQDNNMLANSTLREYSVSKMNVNSFDKIQEINFKKIKIRYEVNAVFALK